VSSVHLGRVKLSIAHPPPEMVQFDAAEERRVFARVRAEVLPLEPLAEGDAAEAELPPAGVDCEGELLTDSEGELF